jgi:hypothetical protein
MLTMMSSCFDEQSNCLSCLLVSVLIRQQVRQPTIDSWERAHFSFHTGHVHPPFYSKDTDYSPPQRSLVVHTKVRTESTYTPTPSYTYMVWNIYHTGNFTNSQYMVFVLLLVKPSNLGLVINVTSGRRNTNMTRRGEFLQFPQSIATHTAQDSYLSFTAKPTADSKRPTWNTHKTIDSNNS